MMRVGFWLRALTVPLMLSCTAHAAEFRIEEAPSASAAPVEKLRPGTIIFSDHRADELADANTGLIRFEDWGRERPLQKRLLSLHPAYEEPTVNVTVNGLTKRHKEKLHVYVVEARFLIGRPPGSIDLARYATLDFVRTIDPAIKHRVISVDQAIPNRDSEFAYNKRPDRPWCGAGTLCIESRYQLEGKLPVGIRLANKIEESGKKVSEALEFQSELRVVPAEEAQQAGLATLTGVPTPVIGAIEQTVFHVNQMMQTGKLLAVLQGHPANPNQTIATVFMALAIETDVLEKKKEYERVPVLRNLVPAQVLMGNSSFNTGESISAGLPSYTRNRIRAIATLLQAS